MVFAIDLQNDYLDPAGKFYFPQVENIKQAMRERLEQALAKGELIAYTKNIYPEAEYAERTASQIAWAEAIHDDFKELLANGQKFEKIHYGISPEGALKFREEFAERKADFEFIEFLGVETNVCVLSNISIVQNIFPESGLMISPGRTAARDDTLYEQALAVMRGLKVEVLDEV